MEIKLSFSPLKILEKQSSIRPIKYAVRMILLCLQKYFGVNLLLETPPHMKNVGVEMLPVLYMAKKLSPIIAKTKKIPGYPDEPKIYLYETYSSDDQTLGWGSDFASQEKAAIKSIAEGIERYLWINHDHFYKNKTRRESYEKIRREALNIMSIPGFSEKDKETNSELRFDKHTKFQWLKVKSIISFRNLFLPIQLFSAHFYKKSVQSQPNQPDREPMLRWPITTGLATGRDIDEALVKGILEIVERDAFMISYLNKLSPKLIDLDHLSQQDAEIKSILDDFKRCRLEVYLVSLPTDFPVLVMASVIIDRTRKGPALSVGASADFDRKKCIMDALSESLAARIETRKLVESGNYPADALANMTRGGRLIYWSKSENLPKIDFFINGEKEKINIKNHSLDWKLEKAKFRKKYYRHKLNILKKSLVNFGYEAGYIEITPKKIRRIGLRSVVVAIPDLQPIHLNEKFPYLDGHRLKSVPSKLGLRSAEEINRIPHPFP